MRLLFSVLLGLTVASAQPSFDVLHRGRPILDAHNCYPYEGKWADRIDRALASGSPVAIEQDVAWAVDSKTGKGGPVVSHDAKTTGAEPSLRSYFFERVRPIVEKALAQNDHASWPVILLHFDFKASDERLLKAVWDLLGEYQAWLTTAPKLADPDVLAPLDIKPVLVITEDSDEQEQFFFRALPPGAKLRLFGSAHMDRFEQFPKEDRPHLMATTPPEKLLTENPSNYRRWWNNSWAEVEEGGQEHAGAWTEAGARRLRSLVDLAHQRGFWIRFYTLDGFTEGEDRGWDKSYNFGSRQAAEARWRAAIEAGVNLIATDQYEALGRQLAISK